MIDGKRIKKRYVIIPMVVFQSFLGGCQQYEIKYIGQTPIVAQKIKIPDSGPPGHYDQVKRDNIAVHFSLENMKIDKLMKMDFDKLDENDFTMLEAFICGEEKFETTLTSALYFSDELEFANGAPKTETEKSFYGVFVPHLFAEMKEVSVAQDKSICIRVSKFPPFGLKRISNSVKLDKME